MAFAASFGAAAAENCTLSIVTALPMDIVNAGVMTVPVTLNNKPFHMLVDTGDYFSVITDRTAKVLGVEPMSAENFMLKGWGGTIIDHFVNLDQFGFGRLARARTQFMVTSRDDADFDGLLGADFLYFFDLDFDFAKAKLNLISPNHCEGKVVYWTKGGYGLVPFDYKDRSIQFTVQLDGKEVRAVLDTGAYDTVMSLEKAEDLFGVDAKTLAEHKGHYPFKTLSFGDVSVAYPDINLVSEKKSKMLDWGGPRLLLGMGVLRRLHLYISYKEEKLYVTPATQYDSPATAPAASAAR
jgi:predicted aspartyl protease